MRLHHLMQYLTTRAWASEPNFLAVGRHVLREALAGRALLGADLHAALDVPMEEERDERKTPAKVAVVPIFGVIDDRASSLGTSAATIERAFDTAQADKRIDGILFDIDSPGGVVGGIPELADKIAAGTKPMLAFNGGMMASAAYWLGAAAGEVVVSPSSQTGSIGVYTFHEDWTEHLANEGIKVTEIAAGESKTETAPWNPLTDEAKAHLERTVQTADGWFVKSVAASRKTTQSAIREMPNRGRTFLAQDAVTKGLVDDVGTFEQAVARLGAQIARRKPAGRRASALAREHDLAVSRGVY